MKETFDARRKLMVSELEKIPGIKYIHPAGAFYVMVDIAKLLGKKTPGGAVLDSAYDVAARLLSERMVAAIPCESFGAPEYLRLSYAISDKDIKTGLDRFAAFVKSLE